LLKAGDEVAEGAAEVAKRTNVAPTATPLSARSLEQAVTREVVEQAVSWAAEKELGEIMEPPDLSGTWTMTNAEPDLTLARSTTRTRAQRGVYRTSSHLTLSLPDRGDAVQVAITVVELYGTTQLCGYVHTSEVTWTSPELDPQIAKAIADGMTPASLNEEPCEPVVELDADAISTRGKSGTTYRETRVRDG
jgi:hypothetical protein